MYINQCRYLAERAANRGSNDDGNDQQTNHTNDDPFPAVLTNAATKMPLSIFSVPPIEGAARRKSLTKMPGVPSLSRTYVRASCRRRSLNTVRMWRRQFIHASTPVALQLHGKVVLIEALVLIRAVARQPIVDRFHEWYTTPMNRRWRSRQLDGVQMIIHQCRPRTRRMRWSMGRRDEDFRLDGRLVAER